MEATAGEHHDHHELPTSGGALTLVALSATLHCLTGCAIGEIVGMVVPIALATDTASIAVMEFVDNVILLLIPGAMEAGLGDVLFWGALSVALVIAGAVALPLNRWLIARGQGHAVLHETGIHGGPSPRLIGAIAVVAFVFGTAVLIGELTSDDGGGAGHAGVAADS